MNDLSYKKKTQIKKLREKSYKRNPRSLKLNNLKKNLSSSINLNNDCQNFGKSFLKPDYSFKNNYSLRKDFLIKDVKNLILNNKDTKKISKMNKRNNSLNVTKIYQNNLYNFFSENNSKEKSFKKKKIFYPYFSKKKTLKNKILNKDNSLFLSNNIRNSFKDECKKSISSYNIKKNKKKNISFDFSNYNACNKKINYTNKISTLNIFNENIKSNPIYENIRLNRNYIYPLKKI